MKTLAHWTRAFVLLGVMTSAASLWGGGAPLGYVKTHTLQNLAPSPSRYLGHYLSTDVAGQAVVSAQLNRWEFKPYFWKDRGYLTHFIVQRGDNGFNGKYLNLDPATGQLGFTSEPLPTARWLVRYAGKYQGWDAFHIQNLAEQGAVGLGFLAIDEASGEVVITSELTAGSHWLMSDAPYLPSETVIP
jgi:hypothetical protein